MNEDRFEGAATTLAGRAKTSLGELTGDRKLQSEGMIDKAQGTAQNLIGGAQDAVRSAFDKASPEVRDTAERAIGVARKSPLVATLAVGAVALFLAKLLGGSMRSERKNQR